MCTLRLFLVLKMKIELTTLLVLMMDQLFNKEKPL